MEKQTITPQTQALELIKTYQRLNPNEDRRTCAYWVGEMVKQAIRQNINNKDVPLQDVHYTDSATPTECLSFWKETKRLLVIEENK